MRPYMETFCDRCNHIYYVVGDSKKCPYCHPARRKTALIKIVVVCGVITLIGAALWCYLQVSM